MAIGGRLLPWLLGMLAVWPIVATYVAWLGLQVAVPPILLVYSLPLLCFGWWLRRLDPWAAAFGLYILTRAVPFPPLAFETTVAVFAGLALYAMARGAPAAEPNVRAGVLVAGAFTAGYMLGEYAVTALGFPIPSGGAIGNRNFVGAFLAISAAVVPGALLPLWVAGVAASKCFLGALAFGACLLVRFRARWGIWVVSGGAVALTLYLRGLDLQSLQVRLAVWQWGLEAWGQAPTFGFGPGAWARAGVVVTRPMDQHLFAQAHNEWIQLAVEGGLVALCLVAGWCWAHRRALLAHPWGPALAAIGVETLGMFPFQIPAVAALCLVAMGYATGDAKGTVQCDT